MRPRLIALAAVLAAAAGTVALVTLPGGAPASSDFEHGDFEVTVPHPGAAAGACGVERWSVKTGSDADRLKIKLGTITPTTLAHLDLLPKPSSLPSNNRIAPTEMTVLQEHVTLVEYKLESDSDYHLVLQDSAGNTMITEIPDPACVSSSSVLASRIRNSRAEFDAKYTPTTSFQQANVQITVTGVGFFDTVHGQTGVAPNGVELHAVTDVNFGANHDKVTVTSPGNQSSSVGSAVSLQIHATDSVRGQVLYYAATGLPHGLAINSSSGVISGTPSTAGSSTVKVTVTDARGTRASASFGWTTS